MALHSIMDMPSLDVGRLVNRMPVAVIPFGSVEQHGPHLPCGTDTFASELVAKQLARALGCLYVPFSPYGITPPHVGFPGTISLSRSTFEGLVRDICTQLITTGVRLFVLVNWHEAHIPSLNAICTDLQFEHDAMFIVAHAQFVAQRIYAPHNGKLTHAGGIETLAVMAHDPSLVHADRFEVSKRTEQAEALDAMRRSYEVYGFITDVRKLSEAGWYGDPAWATQERAKEFDRTVAADIAERLEGVWKILGIEPPRNETVA
ncbi:MAG TPA: creatininase family protein [Streptosporangiaceae bacterium]|nr:creatininase family protein [Streptosporangiaceae bacterium]